MNQSQLSHPSGAVERKEAEGNTETGGELNRTRKRSQQAGGPRRRVRASPPRKRSHAAGNLRRRIPTSPPRKRPRALPGPSVTSRQEAESPLHRILASPPEMRPQTLLATSATPRQEAESPFYQIPASPPASPPEMRSRTLLATSDTSRQEAANTIPESAPYGSQAYEVALANQYSYMCESILGITNASKSDIQTLLDRETSVPNYSDDQFQVTYNKIRSRSESQDVYLLLVPSKELLAIQGGGYLEHLTNIVNNEGWNSSSAATNPHPQPDFSVGFRQSVFTEDQVERLEPFFGSIHYTASWPARWQMYFPFLINEQLYGPVGLHLADQRNASAMTEAVRGVFELFKYVRREKEVDREILAFSISHDDSRVRFNGHYAVIGEPVMDEPVITFHRHPILEFSPTMLDGKEEWTTYKFMKNIYEIWMPAHLKRLRSAIDSLPPNNYFRRSSFTSMARESERPEAQEMATSAPSYQNTRVLRRSERPEVQEMTMRAPSFHDTGVFRRPGLPQKLPPKATLQRENDRLYAKLDEERERREQETERLRQEGNQERQEAKQENKRLLAKLDEERAQSKRESDRQRHESDWQRQQEIGELKEQIKGLTDMIQQRWGQASEFPNKHHERK